MRLTGGEHRGRRLNVPADGTRPTQDKVRAAVFSSLAARVPGARVLDLFAGTGALGLEAWSRGAAWVDWVENGKNALRALRRNHRQLGVERDAGRIWAADAFNWIARPCAGTACDLIFADPPYAKAREQDWLAKLAEPLVQNGWIKPGGVFVFETEGRDALSEPAGWRLARDKAYGATRVLVWVRDETVA